MRNERIVFGISGRGGSRALVAAAALLAGLSACGDNIQVVTAVPVLPFYEQVTCNVTRTECNGFAATTSALGLDGLDVNCAPGQLTQPITFEATACFLTTPSPDGGTEQTTQEQNDAQTACAKYCADGYGAQHTYPLGAVANQPGSGVTCTSTADLTLIRKEVNGQCSKVPLAAGAAAPGNTVFVNCNLGGRVCNGSVQTAPDNTMYCTNTPLLPSGQPTSTCYDPTQTTAELACQNSWDWPMTPLNAVNTQDWFHWVVVTAPIQEDNEADCQTQKSNIAFAGLGIGSGSIGSFTIGGVTTPLTAKGGTMTVGQRCDSDNEFCSLVIGSMKVDLQDLTVEGLTFHNPEATLITPVSASVGTIAAGTLKLEIEGDITAIGRARTVFTVAQPLTLSTTSTSASLTGSFSTTVATSMQGAGSASVSGSISITGSTTSSNAACASETGLQQLLGFETTADWSSAQASLATTSSLHTQGCFGLQVGGGGYRTLNSTFFATPLPGTTQTLALDVFVPPNPPNPSWLGAVQLYLTCGSANLFNQYIGEDELTGLPLGKFSTLSYPIPAPIAAVLKASHPGCFFSVAVNANQTPTPLVLDNLRFK